MANNQRTYEWVNGRVHEVARPWCGHDSVTAESPRQPKAVERKRRLGIQEGLLIFTLSSVTLVFAGGALAVVAVILYSVLFG